MKTKIIVSALALGLSLCIMSMRGQAQHQDQENKTKVAIETDPSTFLLNGYAFHIRIKPGSSQHLVIGAGTYKLDLPDVMVDLNDNNKAKGWNVQIKSAFSLFGEYYFANANEKWFVGLQSGIQNYENTNDQVANQQSRYSNLLLMPSVGYTWRPFHAGFYVKPWMGVGYTTKISGDNRINNLRYDIAPILPFVTLHIGYVF